MRAIHAALAQYADAMTFAMCVAAMGIGGEANPVARGAGVAGTLLAKAAIIALIPIVERVVRSSPDRYWALGPDTLARLGMAGVAAWGILGAAANTVALARWLT